MWAKAPNVLFAAEEMESSSIHPRGRFLRETPVIEYDAREGLHRELRKDADSVRFYSAHPRVQLRLHLPSEYRFLSE